MVKGAATCALATSSVIHVSTYLHRFVPYAFHFNFLSVSFTPFHIHFGGLLAFRMPFDILYVTTQSSDCNL